MSENTFGKYLKSLRKSFQYTQEFVASQLDISRQAYSHYETGRVIPPNDICIRLASIYHKNAKEILHLALSSSNSGLTSAQTEDSELSEELNDYINYIEQNTNKKRLHFLTSKEKELLFYFHTLSDTEQEDILDFLKIKYRRIKKEK